MDAQNQARSDVGTEPGSLAQSEAGGVEPAGEPRPELAALIARSGEQIEKALGRVLAAAEPGVVFSEPVESGGYTVITASQVTSAGGFGSGTGLGSSPGSGQTTAASSGAGGGMGGGGFAASRPVAAIVIGPDGVRVKPIVDVTRLALAGITAWGAMLVTLYRMRRQSR